MLKQVCISLFVILIKLLYLICRFLNRLFTPPSSHIRTFHRRADLADGVRQEDIAQPTDGVEPGSEMNVALPPIEANVVQLGSEQPMPSSVALTIDATGQPQ